jgi:predicted SprT family Zn-dependent metalloprotease
MPRNPFDPLVALFRQRFDTAKQICPALQVTLHIGQESEFPKNRDYAYSLYTDNRANIVFAPKVLHASRDRQDALIRHEIAHAVLQSAGLDHSERECDAAAERIFGLPIYYDAEDVQTINPKAPGAHRPRPDYLPRGDGTDEQKPRTRRNGSHCGNEAYCCKKCPGCPFR